MKLDVKITQASYWKGAQIPYWLYMAFVIFPLTGLLGVDHLLLRSPMTAFLKFISIIPLFGFWYFYDMAQLGEGELIKQYGIGVPFYGPVGIGAGMFIGKDVPLSPPNTARPWRFIGYFLATMLFIVFPINKLIIGDYSAAVVQFLMYFGIPFLTFVALGWGFYDLYRIIFETRDVFEKGTVRIPPASWIIQPYFNKSVLGPNQLSDNEKETSKNPGMIMTIINAIVGVYVSILKGLGFGAEIAGTAAGAAAAGIINTAETTAEGVITGAGETAKGAMQVAKGAENVAIAGLKEFEKGIPAAVDAAKILAAPSMPQMPQVPQMPQLPQLGGGSNEPSISSSVLLFSIILVSIGGYLIYTLRSNLQSNTEPNDSPPDARAVRGSFKAEG